MTTAVRSQPALPQFTPATWRAASLAPWVCLLQLRHEEEISPAAIQDFSDRLDRSSNAVVQALRTSDVYAPSDHINTAHTQPTLVRAAGQAITTIVQSAPHGDAAEQELLGILRAHLLAHPSPDATVDGVPGSLLALLPQPHAPRPYAAPKDTRSVAFQALGFGLLALVFVGMAFLLQM